MATEKWESFFKEAGIPPGPAKRYAVTFSDNRMRLSMLNDLNKNILQDLGITLIGDIIAILRHSKEVYEQIEREKAEDFDMEDKKVDTHKPKPLTKKDVLIDKSAVMAARKESVAKTQAQASKGEQKEQSKPARKTLSERFSEQSVPPVPKKKPREVKELPVEPTPISSKADKADTSTNEKESSTKGERAGVKPVTVIPAHGQTVTKKHTESVFDRLENARASEKPPEVNAPEDPGSLKPLKAGLVAKKKSMSVSSSIFSRLGDKQNVPLTKQAMDVEPASPGFFSSNVTSSKAKNASEEDRATKKPISKSSSNVFGRLGGKPKQQTEQRMSSGNRDILNLGLSNTHSVLRGPSKMDKPTEYVKPVVRPARMDTQTTPETKSVFSRLGKR